MGVAVPVVAVVLVKMEVVDGGVGVVDFGSSRQGEGNEAGRQN